MTKPAITWYAEYDASLMGLTDGALVETWADAGGTATRDLVGTGTERPTFVASSADFSGRAVVSFDGTNNRLFRNSSDFGSLTQGYTFVLVAKIDQKTSTQVPFSSKAESPHPSQIGLNALASNHATAPNRFAAWAGSLLTASSAPIGDVQVVVVYINGSSSYIRVDGVLVASGNTGTRSLIGFALGQKYETLLAGGTTWGAPAQMRVGYVAVKSGALTTQELADFEAWADTYYLGAPAGDPPQGTTTISSVTPADTSASVTYSYNDTDRTGFEYRLDAGTAASLGASPATITGLTASTTYDLEVRAINATGAGAWSAVSTFTTTAAIVYADEYNVIAGSAFGGPPRTAHYKHGYLFVGSVQQAGHNQRVSRLIGSTWTHTTVATLAGSADVHNNPGVYVGADNHVYTAYCGHGATTGISVRRSATQYGIDFGAPVTISTSGLAAYYPQMIEIGARLYLFAGIGANRDIQYCHSDDNGATWSTWTLLFDGDSGQRPYWMLSEVDGEVAMCITRTNPQDVAAGTNPAFFARFDGTTWRNASGTAYTLPITTATGQIMFDSATVSANAGYFHAVAKDGAGRWFSIIPGLSQAGVVLNVYLCRYDGGWSQTALPAQAYSEGSVILKNATDYEFSTVIEFSGVDQLVRVTSADSGTTWSVERLTDGALTRDRSALRKVFGIGAPEYFIYADITRVSNTDWTCDIYQTFNTTVIPATEIRYQLKSNGTPVADETGIKYALFNGTDPTTWSQIGSGTIASDATGFVAIDTDTTPPGTTRYLVLTKNDGTELNGSGAQGPVVTEVVA